MLAQDIHNHDRFKLGYSNEDGWAAYVNQEHLFLKQFPLCFNECYPDYYASSYEAFTSHYIMEMESLSPLRKVSTDETLEHVETWKLFESIQTPQNEKEICDLTKIFLA